MNMLYTLIPGDPHLLEHIDEMPFVDTPLHIAAEQGHTKFAAEIMRLKPSFSQKLNYHGFTPIHIALQNEHYMMVRRLVQIDEELVRVKGREGLTRLHFVTQMGETHLLAEFLSACSNSIQDVTDKNETALHIAVKNRQIEALKILVGWLSRITHRGAAYLENSILNWKDEEGNTILHISALLNYSELLMNTKVNINAKNFNNWTALDLVMENRETDQVVNAEIKDMLLGVGALRGNSICSNSSLADKLRLKITVFDRITIKIGRYKRSITDDTRNALLVVAVLIATAAYQAALSPLVEFIKSMLLISMATFYLVVLLFLIYDGYITESWYLKS
ncbi:hypothetical protein L6164_001439 [Bauhinia variegata]|uniref:Uncharacterized protein n=1 Tax=Bauhinia variegata TaxID=167791 RepID=A0ACB9Q9N5_BAUVA|nr:hypothetical protein L6164_001439 [Bauhinia variegata]